MKKLIPLLLLLMLLTSCSVNRTIDTKNDYSSNLKDGTYTVISRYFNSAGYKPKITLTIRKGIITETSYQELNSNGVDRKDIPGAVLNWPNCDFSYNEIVSQLYNNTIIYQGNTVDAIAGATQTVTNYTLLQDTAIDSAKRGDQSEKTVDSFNDTYTVTNEVDPVTGSQETLMVEFVSGKVNQVVVREVTNNAAFYVIGRAYQELADSSQANKTLDDVHSTTVDTNIVDRYNNLLRQVIAIRGQ